MGLSARMEKDSTRNSIGFVNTTYIRVVTDMHVLFWGGRRDVWFQAARRRPAYEQILRLLVDHEVVHALWADIYGDTS